MEKDTSNHSLVRTNSRKIPKQYYPAKVPKNIQQPYSLTQQLLSFNFDIYEWRIILRVLQLIKEHQNRDSGIQLDFENNVELIFPVSAFMKDGHKNHSHIRKALKKLREKTISKEIVMEVEIDGVLQKVDAEQFVGIIEQPAYAHNNSFIKLKLSDMWYLYLSDLSRGYTQFAANIAFECTTPNTVKMYLFINQWFKSKGKTLKIGNFKREFNIPSSYSTNKIIHRFLEPVKKELDLTGDRSFNYKIYYTDESEYDQDKPIGGKRAGKVVFVFYNNIKNKQYYELSTPEHTAAQKWLPRLAKRYKLSEEDTKVLYAIIRNYGYGYMFGIEKDKREYLKEFSGRVFCDRFADFARKEKS